MKTATHCETIFTNLFIRGNALTSKEIAAMLGTSPNSIRSRISELRNRGLTVICVNDGGDRFHYEASVPSLGEVALAREEHLPGFYNPAPIRPSQV